MIYRASHTIIGLSLSRPARVDVLGGAKSAIIKVNLGERRVLDLLTVLRVAHSLRLRGQSLVTLGHDVSHRASLDRLIQPIAH